MVTYRLERNDKTLEHDFPQLRYRLQQLQDNLVSYIVRGDLFGLVSYGYDYTQTPMFTAVTFDEKRAQVYEASMERFFQKKRGSASAVLPRPKFSVSLEITFPSGQAEQYEFPFKEYSDERVIAFCKVIEERSVYLFRHRYSLAKKQAAKP